MAMLYFDDFLSKNYRHLYTTLYTTVEYTIFSYIVWFFLQKNRFKTIIIVLSGSFIIFQIIHFFVGTFTTIDSIPIGIESILLFSQILFLFYEQFQKPTQNFYVMPSFWFVIGVLIYLSGSFFFNILGSNKDFRPIIREYWFITYILETIKNVFFAIAIIIYAKKFHVNNLEKNENLPYLDIT
jgi:hypothetical protein